MGNQVFSVEVCYSGHVQGVGFRYATRKVALEFDVCGTVRNLADGRVEVVVEGQQTEVESFLNELSNRQAVYIRRMARKESHREASLRGFEILH